MDLAAKNGWGAGGGAGSPELCSRGGAAPAKVDLGHPGSILDRVWPGREYTRRRTHLGAREGKIRAQACSATAGDGARPWRSPGRGVQAELGWKRVPKGARACV